MIARLQQFITLGGAFIAALWAIACWRAGHPVWGMLGVAMLTCGYAILLAVEFLLLQLVCDSAAPQRPTRAQLAIAWWGEVCMAPRVFCWRQPFFSQRWPDQLPANTLGRRGLLLVHGFVCNRGLWNAWLQLLTRQGVPFVAVNLEPVFGPIENYSPIIEVAVAQLESCTGLPPAIVAHSMGGLAVRYWWAELANDSRVHHLITIGTPHHGTWLARLAYTASARQMRRASPWLRALAQREPPERATRCTCFYSACDNVVFPAVTATLPGADNRAISGMAHVHMADSVEPWNEAQRLLRGPAAVITG